jgi:hypothetical protein
VELVKQAFETGAPTEEIGGWFGPMEAFIG